MNATTLAQATYAASAVPIRSTRNTEYDIMARITHQLKSLDKKKNFAKLAATLHDNRKLWTLFAVDVADGKNDLPELLRAQIFYLAEFTLQHTSKVLAGTADVDALIDINTTVMRGLRQSGNSE